MKKNYKAKKLKTLNFLIENIEGIINQKHPLYKCPCSMEGHISNKYAKFITSSPHSYSEGGLKNLVQLLTMKVNKIKLTEEIYSNFKLGISTYKKLNLEKYINNYRNQVNKLINPNLHTFIDKPAFSMNIIPLFQSFVNHLSNILENNLFL